MGRAIVFDLDDTLYRERRFIMSGFAEVAREVERLFGVPAREAFATMKGALATGQRHRALQALCSRFGWPSSLVETLRAIIQTHTPRLRLPRESVEVLRVLRPAWSLGILTNGRPATQANKIAALGVAAEVDAVVLAEAAGPAKPHPAAFHAVLARLGATAAESIFVGNDPWCDMLGARGVGMKTILLGRRHAVGSASTSPAFADARVKSLCEVPSRVRELAGIQRNRKGEDHAA